MYFLTNEQTGRLKTTGISINPEFPHRCLLNNSLAEVILNKFLTFHHQHHLLSYLYVKKLKYYKLTVECAVKALQWCHSCLRCFVSVNVSLINIKTPSFGLLSGSINKFNRFVLGLQPIFSPIFIKIHTVIFVQFCKLPGKWCTNDIDLHSD